VVLIAGTVLLVLLVGVLMTGRWAIQAWLQGDEFREWLVRRASVTLDSRVELSEMSWQGSEVYADRFHARGYPDAGFEELRLEAIRAQAGGVRDGAFRVPRVTVNRLDLRFGDDRLERPAGVAGSGAEEPPGPSVPGWLQRFVPDRVEVDRVELGDATVTVAGEGDSPAFRLAGVRGEIRPDFRTGFWRITARQGNIAIPDAPELRLQQMALRWKGEDLFVDDCRVGVFSEGNIDGAGEIGFADDGRFDLDLTLSSIDVDELVEEPWKSRLSGIVRGPVRISGAPDDLVYEGTLHVDEAVVESMPVLTLIAEYTRNDQFERLVLSEARSGFRRTGDRTELSEIVLQSDGLVRVEGDVDIVGEQLDGVLQVGVAPGTLSWIPGAERRVFVEERDGFRWTEVRLTGATSRPEEDLSRRLIAAAGEAILEDLPNGLLDEAQRFLDSEKASPEGGEPSEGAGRLLDLISPFLEGR